MGERQLLNMVIDLGFETVKSKIFDQFFIGSDMYARHWRPPEVKGDAVWDPVCQASLKALF
jgi:hypothetical protein